MTLLQILTNLGFHVHVDSQKNPIAFESYLSPGPAIDGGFGDTDPTQPTEVAGTLRRAVRSSAFNGILGGRHMECAYYFDFCRLCQIRKKQWAKSHLELV